MLSSIRNYFILESLKHAKMKITGSWILLDSELLKGFWAFSPKWTLTCILCCWKLLPLGWSERVIEVAPAVCMHTHWKYCSTNPSPSKGFLNLDDNTAFWMRHLRPWGVTWDGKSLIPVFCPCSRTELCFTLPWEIAPMCQSLWMARMLFQKSTKCWTRWNTSVRYSTTTAYFLCISLIPSQVPACGL